MKNMKEVLNGIFENARKEMPELLAIGIVNSEDGMALAESKIDPNFKADEANAYGNKAVNACKKAGKAMSQKNELIEVMMIIPGIFLMFRIIGPKYWCGIALAPNANIGITRVLLKKFEEELMKALY
jgi:hypothetical protein